MITMREIIIFTVVTIVNCQYDYFRPDIQPNELGYNVFGQPFASLIDETNKGRKIPGKSGTDYPVFSQVPETGFRCDQQIYPGYYTDPQSGCQAFYICQRDGRSDSFLCPNGTIFNQEWLVCDWWYNFDCSLAENFYSVNEQVVRSMEEADLRLQDYKYNSLQRFGTNRINGQFNFREFPNVRNSFTRLNSQSVLSNGPIVEYGLPGASGFEVDSGRFKYIRRGSEIGRFVQRNRASPSVFEFPETLGFPGATTAYRRNLFRGYGTVDRSYLPQGK